MLIMMLLKFFRALWNHNKSLGCENGIESSAAIQEIQKEHGSVDILVHNAGLQR